MKYASLHNHSELSLDGIGSVSSWVTEAKAKGLSGLAITDHGLFSSALQLYTAGKDQDFPVVLGSEFYLVETLEKSKENKYCHISVLCKNKIGYQNLCKLSTLSFDPENHFYYKPRITLDELLVYSEGLIVMSGCMLGIIGQTYIKGDIDKAVSLALRFKDRLRDDFYLELVPIVVKREDGTNEQELINKALIHVATRCDIKMVATPDAHMPKKEHKILQDIKLANISKNWKYEDTYYLPTPTEFREMFHENHPYITDEQVDEMFENTNEIVKKAKTLRLEFKPLLPDVGYENSYDAMISFIKEEGRIDITKMDYVLRLMQEIKVIKDNGLIDLTNYFLLLHDLVRHCRANGVEVGFGRGSAGGSLLAYALGITSVDPIKYNLLFTRFLNETRLQKGTLPDIDLDFSDRDFAINYLKGKYGEGRVCKLGTISTIKIKSAIKDTIRALMGEKFDYNLCNNITKSIKDDDTAETQATLLIADEMNKNKEFADFMNSHPDILKTIMDLVGTARQSGVHASAVAITPCDIKDIIPLATSKGEWYTQYTAKDCEKAGVIKFDLLTINTLNYIAKAVDLVEKRHEIKVKKETIPLDDRKIFDEFEKGNTDFVFQFNSDISKSILTQIKINDVRDLSLVTAVGRPGTMDSGMDRQWIQCRCGDRSINYPHPSLKEILEETSGILVYQESLMQAFQILAGFSEGEADDVRRATGKKDAELMQSFKDRFIVDSQVKWPDINQSKAELLWSQLETFANYSFNKSHSICYALTGYVCQYLKTYYPLEWTCGVAQSINTSKMSNKKDKLKELYKCSMNIMILPDINESTADFYIKDGKIISPFSVLNHIGGASVASILDIRNRLGNFVSLADFLLKINGMKVKKDVIQGLIWSGCFSKIEPEKSEKDLILEYASVLLQKAKGKDKIKIQKDIIDRVILMNQIDIAKQQTESLSIYSGNLKNILQDVVPKSTVFEYDLLEKMPQHRDVYIVGTIVKIHEHECKTGTMAFCDIENDGQSFSLTLFPDSYIIHKEMLELDALILIGGSINIYKGKHGLIVESLKILE